MPEVHSLAQYIRERTRGEHGVEGETLVEFLLDVVHVDGQMEDHHVPVKIRVEATRMLLDMGWGRGALAEQAATIQAHGQEAVVFTPLMPRLPVNKNLTEKDRVVLEGLVRQLRDGE